MEPYSTVTLPCRRVSLFLLVFLLVASSAFGKQQDSSPTQPPQHFRPDDIHTRQGFAHFYNLEYDQAIRQFEIAVQQHPDDAFTLNHLLSAVLFKELYRIGALDSELYAKDSFLHSKQFPVDPKAKARIKELIDRSLAVSEAKLKKSPNDVDAFYTRGVTRGLRATYVALIEKAWFSALRSAVGARHDHERVLQLDPNYADAKMIVGIHNYVLGSISWPVKVAASLVGLSGSRKKGIEYLYAAANGGGENAVDSKIALSLFLRREQRYPEAIELINGLEKMYPHNFLIALELANLYHASGKAPEAIVAYRKVLTGAESGYFPDAHVEMASYGLGEALRGQKDYRGAAEAYDKVLSFDKADPDLRLRAQLGAGEMYDLLQKRDEAVKRYQAVLSADNDSPRADEARKYLKAPYHEDTRN